MRAVAGGANAGQRHLGWQSEHQRRNQHRRGSHCNAAAAAVWRGAGEDKAEEQERITANAFQAYAGG